MKKYLILLLTLFFGLFFCSRETYSTQTYIIKTDVRDRVKVPKGTPHTPSKAAKLNTYNIDDEDEYEDEENQGNIAVKKEVKKEVRTEVKKELSSSSKRKKKASQSGKSYYKTSVVRDYNKVNEIGEKLLEANNIRQDIVFTVSSSRVVNAYTDRHNVITVNKGLIRYLENDDELAGLLGHEMGHVLNSDIKKSIAISVGSAILNSASRGYGNVGTELAGKKLSRNIEYAADIAGVDMMVNAGYNPLAMISLLGKISAQYSDILATHPTGKKRILALYNYIETYYPQYIEDGFPTVSYRNALRVIGK